ncbi:MAG TPA: hypothetical protein VNF29_03335 [Candidatus Binataceae bacterium]|nr:hypothetical protein [Candidatus Binataceae bacterium]
MHRRALAIIFAALLLFGAASALANDQPRIIPRQERIDRPIDQVYGALKNYFSDPALSLFHLQSADPTTHTLVATRSGIDNGHWSQWAFCPATGVHMLFQLQDGSVTVTVNLQKSGPDATFASVSADFQGDYALGANEQKLACSSKKTIEEDLLTVAAGGAAKK